MIGILYEHPEWFRPLFAELERRGLQYERLHASEHTFDPALPAPAYSLVVNRMSPSAYLRGQSGAIAYSRDLLVYLHEHGVPLVNGPEAFALELSKVRQAVLIERLGLGYPRTRVVHRPQQVEAATAELEYPLIIKPNLGGSGALMRRFTRPEEVRAAVAAGEIELGPDGLGLVQEYHPPRGGAIVRVEALDGRYLYAIRVPARPAQGFNLCPADLCEIPSEAGTGASAGVRQVEAYRPADDVIEAVLAIMAAGRLDVCGVEYLESERDGQRYFYDVNALSNFVAEARRVVGFDPFVTFVDYLERRSRESAARRAAA
jgi:glutathione synthase/RimK-type ligase-like ATP-grasp enzyme